MIAYASRTGTKRNLDALRAADWRLLVSAGGVWRTEGFVKWAADNGAWRDFQEGVPFDELRFARFLEWVDQQPTRPDFLVAPDIVMGGRASLDFSVSWLPRLQGAPCGRLLLAVQDGMELADVAPLLADGSFAGVFVGGSTEWKLATLPDWVNLAHAHAAWAHAARVNTVRRVNACLAADADSMDGSGPSRFVAALAAVNVARHQQDWVAQAGRASA